MLVTAKVAMVIEHGASSKAVAASAHDTTDETATASKPGASGQKKGETMGETSGHISGQTHGAPHGQIVATPEHPAGPPARLALPARGPLRQGLITAFTDILIRSRQQQPDAEPVRALHEHRKALRRARSLLRLMDGMLGVQARDILASTLRELHQATSALRDRHVALEVLEGLARDEALDEETAALVEQICASIRATPAPGVDISAEALADSVARLESLPRVLSNGLPGKIKWHAIADGVGTTYRRAQRQLRAARRTGADEAVHGLRKRTKELTYQVELLAKVAGKRDRKARKRLSRLVQELGGVSDLMVLRDYMDHYTEPGPGRDRLLATIEDTRARQLAHALKRARVLLGDGHDDFARKLIRAARKGRKAAC